MSWLHKTKTLSTASSVQATGKLFKLPWATGKDPTETQVYDKARRLAELDWDRIVLFKGKWHLPPVTVKPKFEFWNYVKLESESERDPKLLVDPKISTIFRTKNVLLVGAGVLGIVGLACYVRRQQRKRFAANVAASVAASVRDVVSEAVEGAVDRVQEAFQGVVFQQAIGRALENAVQKDIGHDSTGEAAQNVAAALNDVQGALVQALKDESVKDIMSQAAWDAIARVRTQNLTTQELIRAKLDAGAVQDMLSLQNFLHILGLEVNLAKLQDARVLTIKDIFTSSVEQLVRSGISEEHAVKMKNGASYVLDLHTPSFALA